MTPRAPASPSREPPWTRQRHSETPPALTLTTANPGSGGEHPAAGGDDVPRRPIRPAVLGLRAGEMPGRSAAQAAVARHLDSPAAQEELRRSDTTSRRSSHGRGCSSRGAAADAAEEQVLPQPRTQEPRPSDGRGRGSRRHSCGHRGRGRPSRPGNPRQRAHGRARKGSPDHGCLKAGGLNGRPRRCRTVRSRGRASRTSYRPSHRLVSPAESHHNRCLLPDRATTGVPFRQRCHSRPGV